MKTDFNPSFVSPHVQPAWFEGGHVLPEIYGDEVDTGATDAAERQRAIREFILWLTADGKSLKTITRDAVILGWLMRDPNERGLQSDLAVRLEMNDGNLSKKLQMIRDSLKQLPD